MDKKISLYEKSNQHIEFSDPSFLKNKVPQKKTIK